MRTGRGRDAGGRTTGATGRRGTATVDTTTLAVRARADDGTQLVLSEAAGGGLGAPGPVTRTADGARWTYPAKGLSVTARTERGRLRIGIRSDRDQRVSWPVTGTDRAASAVQVPRGRGWTSGAGRVLELGAGRAGRQHGGRGADLALPLWGYAMGGDGAARHG
ncbi:hypothetical protein O1L55_23365 [Streptomyces albulus]|nr:hypothetical protein [Streptomyces noursei]